MIGYTVLADVSGIVINAASASSAHVLHMVKSTTECGTKVSRTTTVVVTVPAGDSVV